TELAPAFFELPHDLVVLLELAPGDVDQQTNGHYSFPSYRLTKATIAEQVRTPRSRGPPYETAGKAVFKGRERRGSDPRKTPHRDTAVDPAACLLGGVECDRDCLVGRKLPSLR